ncbi:MAG TPA: response regulator [Polyangiaceae bacterium]|jgi:CheY-like chemotaxis protein
MATKVLVFESDPGFAGELRNELGKLGCATTVVDDGNVGLQQAASVKPDLILLSIELPRMNGFSVCNKLKKDPALKDVPLIIMSSESSDETFEQHKKLRTRAEDYVHKPIAFGELLQHIQTFVPLGVAPPSETESGIVIDDEIEIGSTDYMTDDDGTQIAPRPPSGMPAQTARGMETVDSDVDAFADAAFGRLTEQEAAQAPGRSTGPNGAQADSVTSPAARRASAPPPARTPSVKPPTTVDIAEYDRLREDLVRTRERGGEVERELADARNEVERLRLDANEAERLAREVEELRTKLASGAKSGGISSRDFLDLREALNKKDKEILSLKEALSRKDKEIVESQDRALVLERGRADLDERLLALERELAETREKTEALSADKDLAKKASDDFKARLEKSRGENDAKDRQLADLRARHAEELASGEARLGALRSELDQTLANERAEHARALDQAEERRKADLDQARKDRDAALADVHELSERESKDALAAQAAELKQEHDGKLAALHRAQQQELERVRSEAAQAVREGDARREAELATARAAAEEQLAAVRKEAEEKLAAALVDAQRQEKSSLDALRAEHAEKIAALENDRDSRVAALEAKAAREIGESNDKLAKAEMDLSATRGELGELREARETSDAAHAALKADLETRLAEVTAARDDLQKRVAGATERVATLEAESASARQDLSDTRQKLAGESSRADKAQAKWESDRQSLERAKDALAVALAQIEEAEGRPIS